ncbi:nuclear transcription factor Y subunit B-like [Primulina eburnea]|uniref:nuclear transcription factor Y subunit B-like n=1 Tax=Primulina eburnea TaxID=1245227 RepID=UPI003C6C7FFA
MTGKKRVQNNSLINNNSMALADTKEQDGFLPIANVSRIMKKSLPANAKISKEAKQTVQECVSEFINFITGEASDKCQREKRKTINGDDLLWAMTTLGFENYVGPLKDYLNKYRENTEGEKNTVATQEDPSLPATNRHGEKIEDIAVCNSSIVSMGFAARPDDHDLWDFKTYNSNYLGIGLPDDPKRSHYGEQMNVGMINNADDLKNGKSYIFDENSNRIMESVGEHGVEW